MGTPHVRLQQKRKRKKEEVKSPPTAVKCWLLFLHCICTLLLSRVQNWLLMFLFSGQTVPAFSPPLPWDGMVAIPLGRGDSSKTIVVMVGRETMPSIPSFTSQHGDKCDQCTKSMVLASLCASCGCLEVRRKCFVAQGLAHWLRRGPALCEGVVQLLKCAVLKQTPGYRGHLYQPNMYLSIHKPKASLF